MELGDLCAPPSTEGIELLVDLSNICRNTKLDSTGDPARWDRLFTILQAWNDWAHEFKRPIVFLIADQNLRFNLSPRDRGALDRAIRSGFAKESPKADPLLLELAERYDCMILSNDNFVGYRRERPWIEKADSTFVQVRTTQGKARLEVVKLSRRSSYSESRAEEQDNLKDLHIDPERDLGSELLTFLYRCDNSACLRRSFLPEGAATTPERDRSGQAVCPGCHEPLTRVGGAQPVAILKIFGVGAGEARRIPITTGSSVMLGRARDGLSLDDVLAPKDLRRISRQHLRVTFDALGVRVVDLGSTNGSTIQRWDRNQRTRRPATPLVASSFVDLKPQDLVIMAGVLCLERSGRRFPFDLGPILPHRAQAHDSHKTVIQTGEES